MGKLSTFKIVFSKNKDKYQPGDLVEGHVAIEIKDGIKVKGIYLECVGEASVGWSESQPTNSDKNRRNHIRYYKANETYFRYERELMKRTSERRNSISVNEGSYMYPFSFRLPPTIPSSFEGSLGHIRYWVSGTVEKAWGSDHISKVDLKITKPLDLNLEKDAPLVVHPSGPAFDLKVPLKVIVGTIPLRAPGDASPGPSGLCSSRPAGLESGIPRNSLPATSFNRSPHLPNVPENPDDQHKFSASMSPMPEGTEATAATTLPSTTVGRYGRSKRRVSCHQ